MFALFLGEPTPAEMRRFSLSTTTPPPPQKPTAEVAPAVRLLRTRNSLSISTDLDQMAQLAGVNISLADAPIGLLQSSSLTMFAPSPAPARQHGAASASATSTPSTSSPSMSSASSVASLHNLDTPEVPQSPPLASEQPSAAIVAAPIVFSASSPLLQRRTSE